MVGRVGAGRVQRGANGVIRGAPTYGTGADSEGIGFESPPLTILGRSWVGVVGEVEVVVVVGGA